MVAVNKWGMILLLTGFLTAMAAPQTSLRFREIGPDQGLPHSQITSMIQDRLGFMWFGTQGGLCRYDGFEFKVFHHDPFDNNTLSHTLTNTVFEAKDGSIWVGTFNGLNRLEPDQQKFRHWLLDTEWNHVTRITEDWDGFLWIGTNNGLIRMAPDSGEIRVQENLGHVKITAMIRDQRGNIWVAPDTGGILMLDPTSGQRTDFPLSDGVPQTRINNICEDQDGRLWLASMKGLLRLNPKTGAVESWQHDPKNPRSIGPGMANGVFRGQNNALWVTIPRAGLMLMDKDEKGFSLFTHDPVKPLSISANNVQDVFEDRSGVLWVQLPGIGLCRADTHAAKFQHYTRNPIEKNTLSALAISAIYKDFDGILWVGTFHGGLNRFDRKTGEITQIGNEPEQKQPLGLYIKSLFGDQKQLYIGTFSGLFTYERNKKEFRFHQKDRLGNPLPRGGINSIQADGDQHLWLATVQGAYRVDRDLEDFELVPGSEGLELFNIRVSGDREYLWMASLGRGLHRYHLASGEMTSWTYDHANNQGLSCSIVTSIYAEPDSQLLWLGTYGGGLDRFDTQTGTSRAFTENNSDLCHNEIYGILGDERGNLWLSTGRGISCFSPETEKFRSYDISDGLQAMEFSAGAYHRGWDGELFFGGINGFNAFYPDRIRENPLAPSVVLTGFRLGNQPVFPGRNSPLREPLPATKTIELSHRQNDISFDFATLHYSRPEKNTTAYILENYEDQWNQSGNQRTARYTNLDPGTYTFKVKGASADGVLNEVGAGVKVIIHPPWWQTNWAYVFYILLGVALALTIDHIQRERFIQKERSNAEMEQARLRAKAAESNARASQAQAQALQSEYKRKEVERMLLEAENSRKTRELEEARCLQLSMLPRTLPALPFLEIAVHMETATEVGGDYYDFKVDKQGHLLAAIGDATGHGLQAGTMVAATKSLFNSLSTRLGLCDFLVEASQSLKAMGFKRMYMALMLVRLEPRKLTVTCAGMPSMIILRASQSRAEEIRQRGMPLGVSFDYPYEEATVPLEPGDMILLMSDGFQELFNPRNEILGLPRLIEWFSETRGLSPEQTIKHLVEKGIRWTEGRIQEDDITFMALKVKAP